MKLPTLAGALLFSGAFAQTSPFVPTVPPAVTVPGLTPAQPLSGQPLSAQPLGGTPTLPAPAASTSLTSLAAPRVSSADGTTRVAFDLPLGTRYTLTPTFGGLRVDFSGVTLGALAARTTPELSGLQAQAGVAGAVLTLLTPFPLGLTDGWRSFELAPQDGLPRRLVIDLGATLRGGQRAASPVVAAPPAPPPAPSTALPILPLPAEPSLGRTPLGAPRVGKSPGSTRVVLEVPHGTPYTVASGAQGLRVDLVGVTAAATAAQQLSPELAEWREQPTQDGVGVTLRTPFALSDNAGWRMLLLPPADGGSLDRLVIDLSPAYADTTPLSPADAVLPRFPLPVRVVLDPGHGGTDGGAVGSVIEKQVTLDVGLRVRALLQAAGAQVMMTRDRDTQLSLDKASDLNQRAAMGALGDVYVSIHVNAIDKTAVLRGYGVETWWYPNNAGSPALAASLQNEVVGLTGNFSQGLKSGSLAVLRRNKVPAALIEIGYTSHPIDGQNLLSSNYLDRVAMGIARGIQDFLVGQGGSDK